MPNNNSVSIVDKFIGNIKKQDKMVIEDIEQKFQESCNVLSKRAEDPKSTAAWVWGNTPKDQKQQVIEKFEHQFGIILKEKLKMNE